MNNILVNGNISTKVKIEIGGQNNDKKKLWQTKRITLVALVVTIVVLLILAGITITYVMGDNSIFKKAQEAKNKTEEAMQNEQEYLNNLGNTIHDYINGTNPSTPSEKATKLELNSVRARIATGYTRWLTATATPSNASQEFEWTSSNTEVATVDNKGVITAKKKGTTKITVKTKDGSNLSKECSVTIDDGVDITTLTSIQPSNKVAKDSYGNLITVPGGFKVLTSEATNATKGIVIQDNEGNEFVWIPVDSISKGADVRADDIRLGRYIFDIILDPDTREISGGTGTIKQTITDGSGLVDAWVEINGGGYEYLEEVSTSTTYANTKAKDIEEFKKKTTRYGGYYLARYEASKGTDNKAKSKSAAVWNKITQQEAATAAREMYENTNFESDLVNSYAWDTAIVFIQTYSGDGDYSIENAQTFSDSLVNTGTNGDKRCNIYNMASNTWEWTTETSTSPDVPGTSRGGYYIDNFNCTAGRHKHRYGR